MPPLALTEIRMALEQIIQSGSLDDQSLATLLGPSELPSSSSVLVPHLTSQSSPSDNTIPTSSSITSLPTTANISSTTTQESNTVEMSEVLDNVAGLSVNHMTNSQVLAGATLALMPPEIKIQIFGYLDSLDSVSLALASPGLYDTYAHIHKGQQPVALNARRIGPNNLESCWEVVGVTLCVHCGADRCELWRHIQGWITKNNNLEYCSMKHKFGSPAKPNAAPNCYRNKPTKPRRCGRHPSRTTTMHQDDNFLPS